MLVLCLFAVDVARAQAVPPPPAVDAALLEAWVRAVGPRKDGEDFGALVARTAQVQLGRPYLAAPEPDGPEWVHADLSTFHCVSLVESSVALSRCLWQGQGDAACFLRELERVRYRGGRVDGFASRLHYFADWIQDNASRATVLPLTAKLGGRGRQLPFFYMSAHAAAYPPMVHPEVRAAVLESEVRLSHEEHTVIERGRVASVLPELRDGDIVAVVGDKPGILVSHTGLVLRGAGGAPHLLHASSYHRRVLLTATDVLDYLRRRSDRRGLMVARPLAP